MCTAELFEVLKLHKQMVVIGQDDPCPDSDPGILKSLEN
jgi:hypothetical protein